MSSSFTRLHPDLPLCWEDTDTLRLGFESAEVRIPRPTAGVQRLLGLFHTGIDSEHIAKEAIGVGATPREARKLLEQLAPALLSVSPASNIGDYPLPAFDQLSVQLCDGGRPVAGLQEALVSSKICTQQETPSPDLVVFVERFLEPLERAQRWLMAAQPHLLVRFTDRAILVGPLVAPEGNPCHTCDALTETSRDSALPAIAAQLHDAVPASETSAGIHMAAAWIAASLRAWIAGDTTVHETRVRIPVSLGRVSGPVTTHTVAPHPECACNALSSLSPLPR